MCLRLSSNYVAVIERSEMSPVEKLTIVSFCFKVSRGVKVKIPLVYMGKGYVVMALILCVV